MWRTGLTGAVRRRRRSALEELVDHARRTGNFSTPWQDAPGIWEQFPDESAVLCALQAEWRIALAGAVYLAIEAGDGDLPRDVRQAVDKTLAKYPGLRRILDANREHPAIAAAMRKEKRMLACFETVDDSPQAA